jgi:hypothetical protein
MRCSAGASRPLASGKLGTQAAILIGLDPNPIEQWRVAIHRDDYAGASMAPSRLDRHQFDITQFKLARSLTSI